MGQITLIASQAAQGWASTHGIRILAVVLLVIAARVILPRILPPAVRRAMLTGSLDLDRSEISKRADTLSSVILRTTYAIIFVVALFFILAEVGFNIAPVLAGISVTSIAIGLGAQTLVKDGINGLFIIGENQFRVGDLVTVAGVSGRVEEVNLRRTLLRDEDGTVYSVPNSAIVVAGNHTRGYSGVYFTVGISYLADLQRAIEQVNLIGQTLASDERFARIVLEPPHTLRIDSLEDSYLNLRITGRVMPGAQAEVTSELRRRIIEEFDRQGIAYRGSPNAKA